VLQIKKIFFFISILFFSIINLSLFYVIYYKSVNSYITGYMFFKSFKTNSLNRRWVSLKETSPVVTKSVIAAEDQRFYSHYGFDVKEIRAAIIHNRLNNNKRGASTISQQVAKNVFLFSNRSWLRKILEAYYTVLIEHYWGKDRILEVYLNIAETGFGIYGVEGASLYYFKKTNQKLTYYQAASIIASLPNPIIYSANKYNDFLNERRWRIINKLNIF